MLTQIIRRASTGLVRPLLVAAAGLLFAAAVPQAQMPTRLAVGAGFGPSPYDLSGTGTGFVVSAQLPWRIVGPLVLEPGVAFFTYTTQFDGRTSYLFPELSVQVEAGRQRFRPFLGAGAGAGLSVAGSGDTEATLHGVVGLRAALSPVWGLVGAARARAVRPWSGNTLDFTLSVSRRLR